MKYLTLLFALFHYSINAQNNSSEKKWILSLQLNSVDKIPSIGGIYDINDHSYYSSGNRKNSSVSFGISASYSLRDAVFARLKTSLTLNRIKETNHYTLIQNTITSDSLSVYNNIFFFAPGLFFYTEVKPLIVYFGFEIPIISGSGVKIESSSWTIEQQYDTIYDAIRIKSNLPPFLSMGPATCIGIQVKLLKQITFGSELDLGLVNYRINGLIETNTTSNITTSNTYPPTITNTTSEVDFRDSFVFYRKFSLSLNFHF
jgi:hypothetical protein